MSTPNVFVDQRRLQLGPRLGKGGEGEVFSLEREEANAVKIYTVSDLAEREQKVEIMIRDGMASKAPQVAFPLSVARDETGRFSGFLMKNALGHKPLHELYSPGSRKIHFPQADYRFLVRTAQNVAKAIASVHAIGCVIGDINQSSILISKAATVALIDSDSFQVTDGDQTFFCRVGVPEYTPPEMQGVSLAKVPRTANHDAFGLAIVVFQLLFMGRHPFVGSVRRGEIPSLYDSIRDFRFVYTEQRDVGMAQPPGTPTLSAFPEEIAAAFETAFGRETVDARPTAQQWIDLLGSLEESLVRCAVQKLHWHPSRAQECPWCAMEATLGATLFVSFIPPAERTLHAFDPGAGGFNLAAIWQQIAAFPQSTIRWLPALPATTIRPSSRVRLGRWRGRAFLDNLKREYVELEQKWLAALNIWRTRTGVAAIEDLLQELRAARDAYDRLASEEKLQLLAYERGRRVRQLHAYLDRFEIRRANIRGIGPAQEIALASFGIDTAADLSESKLMNVPGFAHADTSGLFSWRRRLESQFAYDAKENDQDRAETGRIRAEIHDRAATLRRMLLAGRANLDNAANRVSAMLASRDPELTRLHELRAQLRVDLQHLGVDVKTLVALATNSTQLATAAIQARKAQAQAEAQAATGPNARRRPAARTRTVCPQCGSMMTSGAARNNGSTAQNLWICSRYPTCLGTMN
jgi:DNA-binding helix-hairpin-helix protein with protein kinase domain